MVYKEGDKLPPIFKAFINYDEFRKNKVPQEVVEKEVAKYMDVIVNQWDYKTVSYFLNVIATHMVNHEILIMKVDPIIIDRLLKRVKEKNYDSIEDWFKEQIRKELSQ